MPDAGQGVRLTKFCVSCMIHRIAAIFLCALVLGLAVKPASAELRFVTRGKSSRIIIFLDGLQSDPAKSFRWGEGVGSWPELMAGDSAPDGKQWPLSRYDTAVLSFAGSAADRISVPQLATKGLADLRAKGVVDGYDTIIFIAHGAGGLVLKSMLVQSAVAGSSSLAAKTRVAFLLSVPAEGKPAANFMAALAQNQSLAVSFGTVDVATFLQGLESLWSEYLSRRTPVRRLEVYCRSETEVSFGVKIAAGQYTTEGCDDNGQETGTDHNSIARPASREAGVYRWVRTQLADYFQRFPPDGGKVKPPIVVASAEGAARAVPESTEGPPLPLKTVAPPPPPPVELPKVAAAAPATDLSPVETPSAPAFPAVPAPAVTPSPPPVSGTAPEHPRFTRAAPPAVLTRPARTGDWTFALKGADCNLTSQLWVVQVRDRKLTSDAWNAKLAQDGKFAITKSSACATELVRGKVAGTLGVGWYLYADPCNAIYCRTKFKMTWRLPVEASR